MGRGARLMGESLSRPSGIRRGRLGRQRSVDWRGIAGWLGPRHCFNHLIADMHILELKQFVRRQIERLCTHFDLCNDDMVAEPGLRKTYNLLERDSTDRWSRSLRLRS